MNAIRFQALVSQRGELLAVQREALISALKRRLPPSEAIDLIDSRFSANSFCGHCGSRRVGGWSSQAGLKRYRCKDCAKTFNALTGTPLAQLHRRDAWFAYAQALADGLSLRKAATRCGVSLDTAFRWRHRFLTTAKDAKPKVVAGIVEVDETFIRKSVKGSKRLVGRAPRKRGSTEKSGLSSDDYAPVLIVRDRHGETTDQVLPDLEESTFVCVLKPVVASDALLVSDGRSVYATSGDFRHQLAGFTDIENRRRREDTLQRYLIEQGWRGRRGERDTIHQRLHSGQPECEPSSLKVSMRWAPQGPRVFA